MSHEDKNLLKLTVKLLVRFKLDRVENVGLSELVLVVVFSFSSLTSGRWTTR